MSAQNVRDLCHALILRRANEDFSGLKLKDWILLETDKTVEAYAQAIKTHHWGGYLEMKLISDFLCRHIVVYGNYSNAKAEHLTTVETSRPLREPIYLLYSGRVHYDALIK
jgi:hypothetical protein